MTTSPQHPLPLVLIVDDDATFRMLSRMSLEQDELHVEEAMSGEAAIEFVSSTMPDILILDLQMPGMDGFAVCKRIRQLPHGSFVPILIMTGLDDVDSIAQAYEMGATDFIVKPCHGLMLSQRVRYMLRASHTMSALRTRESQLAQAQRIARLGGWEWDLVTDRMDLSEAACRILGSLPGSIEPSQSAYLSCVHDGDRKMVAEALHRTTADGSGVDMDHRLVPRDGVERIVHLLGEVTTDSRTQARRLVGTVQDVTDERAAEAKIYFMANYDSLTHLPNRNLFLHRIGQVVTSGTSGHSAVLVIRLDQYHRICERHGAQSGDHLIREVVKRLQQSLSVGITFVPSLGIATSLLARLSDGQLALLLTDLTAPEDSARIAQSCLDALRTPFQIGSNSLALSATIGVAIPGTDGTEADQILRNAGTAAQSATRKGPNSYQFYSDSMNASITARVSLEQDLRTALAGNQFLLHYQPKVDILSEQVIGFEALIRWQHPTRGLISPMEFIPVAEEESLIIPLSEWVIRSVAQQQRTWHQNGLAPLSVSINLSGLHFRQRHIASHMKGLVFAEGGNPQDIELELTESVLMMDASSTATILQELKESGFRLAIDDFGTGYSSLAYLQQFPIDTLKIDQAFIKDLKLGKGDSPIMRAIIGMGRALKLHIVAEGVETRDQLAFLRLQGCDAYQGYLFSKPVPAQQLQSLLRNRLSDEVARTKDRSRNRLTG
ncbi:MAG: EAL domain-containing protein [Nitrospira sp.]|nr:EAL domain-containing protein [Nitrospira sp.]MDH4304886.1 EAL domain-containing protein [Nitrospira sp.]MDH5194412.1 EAL domain-containing protein [Nitrospira sp.]